MDIISITVDTNGADSADVIVLGQKPSKKGAIIEDSPVVTAIKFFETSTVYTKVYRGAGIYIIEFEGSTVKRLIPATAIIDIAVETATKPAAGAVKALPALGDE